MSRLRRIFPGYTRCILNITKDIGVSKEEAALQTLKQNLESIKFDVFLQKELIKAYENLFEKVINQFSTRGETHEYIEEFKKEHIHQPKHKSDHDLFLKFYKSAKKDMKEKGEISKETLKIVENAKSE